MDLEGYHILLMRQIIVIISKSCQKQTLETKSDKRKLFPKIEAYNYLYPKSKHLRIPSVAVRFF